MDGADEIDSGINFQSITTFVFLWSRQNITGDITDVGPDGSLLYEPKKHFIIILASTQYVLLVGFRNNI